MKATALVSVVVAAYNAERTIGETLRSLLAAVRRLTRREVCNTVALRRLVADAAIEQVGYPLG